MGRAVEARAGLRVEPELLWSVLTDFEQWQDWLGTVRRSQVLVREGGVAVVEILPLGLDRRLLFEMVEQPGVELRITEIGRFSSDRSKARLRLVQTGEGREVRVDAAVDPGGRLWRPGRRRRARQLLRQALDALCQRCLEVSASPFASDPQGARVLLELQPGEGELILRVGDKRYRLEEIAS